MSKYIRTNTGIYAFKKGMEIQNFYLNNCSSDATPYLIFDDKKVKMENLGKVIKQADAVEDLCDCLMFVDKQKDFLITDVNRDNMNYYDNKKETCYGCIKVELPNGAIRIEPVAKMDNEGDLELINIKESKVND